MVTSFRTYLHHNFTVWYDTCCFVRKEYFNLNYRDAWENSSRSLKGTFCIISIGENTPSIEYSDIYHALSNLFLQLGFHSAFLLLSVKFLSVKIRKTDRAPNVFIWSINQISNFSPNSQMATYLESLSSMVHFPSNHVKELELSHNCEKRQVRQVKAWGRFFSTVIWNLRLKTVWNEAVTW